MQQLIVPAVRALNRLDRKLPDDRDVAALRLQLGLIFEALKVRVSTESTRVVHKPKDWAGIKRRQRERLRAQAATQ